MGGNPNVIITTRTYNIVIYARSKSDCEGTAQQKEDILRQMEQFHNLGNVHAKPDVNSFTGVTKAWV
jgi:predicted site-specific integrase-resolvase